MKNTIKFHAITIAVLSSIGGAESFAAPTFGGTQYDTYKSDINIDNCTLRNIKYHTKDSITGEWNNDGNSTGTFQFISNSNTCNIQGYLNPANQIEVTGSTGVWGGSVPNPYTTQRTGDYYGEIYYANGSITPLTNNNGLDISIIKDISGTAATDAEYLVFKTRRAGWAAIQVTGGSKFIIQDLTDSSLKRSLYIEQYETNGHSLAIGGGSEADIRGDLSVQRTHTTVQEGSSRAIYVEGVNSKLNVGGNLNIAHLIPNPTYVNRQSGQSLEILNSAVVSVGGNAYIYNETTAQAILVHSLAKLDIKGSIEVYMAQLASQTASSGIVNENASIDIGGDLKITGDEHLLIRQDNNAVFNINGATTLEKKTKGDYIQNDNSTINFNHKDISFIPGAVDPKLVSNGLVNTNNGQVYFNAANTSVIATDLDNAIVNSNNATLHFLADNSTVNGNVKSINKGVITLSKGDDAKDANGQYNILYNRLDINGNYIGGSSEAQSGVLTLDTDLVDDSSNTDFVAINGTASGQTELRINSYNSVGAPTRKGIHVIQTNQSDANTFFIANKGYVTAGGAYDYYLVYRADDEKGRNGGVYDNWYLMNYAYDDFVYTPDIGSYLAAETMGNTLFTSRLEDREGASQYQNLNGKDKGNVWIRAYGSHNQFKTMDSQLKTKGNSLITQVGKGLVTLGEENQYNLGVMGGLAYYDGTTQSRISDRESKAKIDGYSLGLYGTWYGHPVEERGAYVDSWILWNQFNNKIDTPDQNQYKYKSSGVTASIEVGGDYLVNENGKKDWWIQPQAQLIYQGIHADNFQDAQGVDVYHGKDNLQARMGIKTYLNIPTNGNKLTSYRPYVALNFIHNTNPYSVTINDVQYVNEGSANQGELKFGVEGHTTKNSQVWVNASLVAGRHDHKTYQGNVGWKYNF